jgi:hypothetical protein
MNEKQKDEKLVDFVKSEVPPKGCDIAAWLLELSAAMILVWGYSVFFRAVGWNAGSHELLVAIIAAVFLTLTALVAAAKSNFPGSHLMVCGGNLLACCAAIFF